MQVLRKVEAASIHALQVLQIQGFKGKQDQLRQEGNSPKRPVRL